MLRSQNRGNKLAKRYLVITILIGIVFLWAYKYDKLSANSADSKEKDSTNIKTILLSSGVATGNYFKYGEFLSERLNRVFEYNQLDYRFRNTISTGSWDNIKLIEDRYSDFAIVQRDVLLENIYNDERGVRNVEVVLPLYMESLIIYKKGDIKKSLAEEFKVFDTDSIKKIGVTTKDGASYKTFESICKILTIPLNSESLKVVENKDYNQLSDSLAAGKIDYIVALSLPIDSIELKVPKINKVKFSDDELTLIDSRIKNLDRIDSAQTVGSWTFLIGLDSSVDEIDRQIKDEGGLAQIIYNQVKESKSDITKKIRGSVEKFQDVNSDVRSKLTGVNLNASAKELLKYNTYSDFFIGIWGLIIIATIALIYKYREQIINFRYHVTWIRYRHIFLGILFMFLLYILSAEALWLFELDFYDKMGIKSRVLNLTKSDLHFWIIITNLTDNSNSIFPLSYEGQIMLSFSSYILIVGTITIALCELIINRINKKRIHGIMSFTNKNHVIIIGWKSSTKDFVLGLLEAQQGYKEKMGKLICIVQDPAKIIESDSSVNELHARRKIEFLAGDGREDEVFKKANIHQANTVIVLSEGSHKEADEKTLLRCLAISRYCKTLAGKNSVTVVENHHTDYEQFQVNGYVDPIYIIAEINDKKYTGDLISADVNEIINGGDIGQKILTQSILNRGVSKVLDQLLKYDESNEFYTIDLKLKKNKSLVDKTYDQLIPILRDKGILLIGIRVVFHDDRNREIIDNEELRRCLKKENLNNQIIINPTLENEKARKTDNDDQLIVLCLDAKDVEQVF